MSNWPWSDDILLLSLHFDLFHLVLKKTRGQTCYLIFASNRFGKIRGHLWKVKSRQNYPFSTESGKKYLAFRGRPGLDCASNRPITDFWRMSWRRSLASGSVLTVRMSLYPVTFMSHFLSERRRNTFEYSKVLPSLASRVWAKSRNLRRSRYYWHSTGSGSSQGCVSTRRPDLDGFSESCYVFSWTTATGTGWLWSYGE